MNWLKGKQRKQFNRMADTSRPNPLGEAGHGGSDGGWKLVRRKSGDGRDGDKDRRSAKWDIAGSGRTRNRKELLSYFFTEFPDDFGAKEMLNIFRLYGEVMEVVIPPKRDRRGKRFGFVRFMGVRDDYAFGVRLDNIIIGSKKIYVNLPRFERIRAQEGVIRKKEIAVLNNSCPGQAFCDTRSFAELVKGVRKDWKPIQSVDNAIPQFEAKAEEMQGLEDAVVGEVRIKGDAYVMDVEMQREGIFTVKAIPMGANFCLLVENEKGSIDDVMTIHKSWMEERFRSFSKWEAPKIDDERVTWVRCLGIPVHGWNKEFFEFLVKPFGSLLGLDEDTQDKRRFDIASLRIATKSRDLINQRVKVRINRVIFEISVVEDVARIGSLQFLKVVGASKEAYSESESDEEVVNETLAELMGGPYTNEMSRSEESVELGKNITRVQEPTTVNFPSVPANPGTVDNGLCGAGALRKEIRKASFEFSNKTQGTTSLTTVSEEVGEDKELYPEGEGSEQINHVNGRVVTNLQDNTNKIHDLSQGSSSNSTCNKGFSPVEYVVQSRFAPLTKAKSNNQRKKGVCALQKPVGSVIPPCLSRSSSISDTVSGKGLVSDKGMVSLDLVEKGFNGDDEKVQGSDVSLISDQHFVEKSARGRNQSCMRLSQSVLFNKNSRLLVGLNPK